MVAPLATTAAATPVPISAPKVGVAATRVVFTVVVMMPSGGCVDRLRAGLSPVRRKEPAPIDKPAQKFFHRIQRSPAA
ncbi:hypothetical protein GCM10010170_037050 [Dactylosporangium salmoneum]|uniref:Secreted protein n=1 Tax=Dactylosporangium salmoneum TaxID=53361 RepID=A0ABP5TCL4_9ACTN